MNVGRSKLVHKCLYIVLKLYEIIDQLKILSIKIIQRSKLPPPTLESNLEELTQKSDTQIKVRHDPAKNKYQKQVK